MKISPLNMLLLTIPFMDNNHEEQVAIIHRKAIVKRDKTPKAKRPGRGKLAKGYDPLTKTWKKP